MSMQNKAEEIKLEQSLDSMIQQVNEIKASINQFLYKLDHEHETLSWPSVLDSFALLSSQINSFHKMLASDRLAPLKNYVFVPIQLNPDRDVALEKLTENRMSAFNHEVVPDYLRTKQEIDVEQKIKSVSDKTSILTTDATTKQINALNKSTSSLCTHIQSKRDDHRSEEGQRRIPESYSKQDTKALVAATAHGKGLVDPRPSMPVVAQHQTMRNELPPHHNLMQRAPVPTINMGGPSRSSQMRPNVRMQPYPYR
ncbi:mediator of RNA polymerase II transcription subunit 8-A-like [Watersipora subatra]|uniref:mediator of RNA polymerase II transcription subunit 8-A-like n=1 Tax=Watersipora subatra TaxID=2589382 RepID=UPI00355AF9A7